MGYIIETRDKERRNPILNMTMIELPQSQLGLSTTFGFKPANKSESVLIKKDIVRLQLRMGSKENFSVTDLVLFKNNWI